MNTPKFKAPFFAREEIWSAVETFRAQYPLAQATPVAIMELVEFDLGMELRPIPGLREENDTDALILADWKTIIVDERLLLDERRQKRLNFSLAHEVGHFILHRAILEDTPCESVEQWVRFMLSIPEREYSFLEYHANEFAGRLLVPRPALEKSFVEIVKKAKHGGTTRQQLESDAALPYLANGLTHAFQVSGEVIEKRLRNEGLWPIQTHHAASIYPP